jgi:predicted RNA-binding Zn-ribbon protein involved in translation (DUF1610 family)
VTIANCPSCGGQVEFQIGTSAVVVCSYCRSVVARTDRDPTVIGKAAGLVDTSSPLRVGLTGKYRKRGFRLTGRTQMRHQAGGIWDEWYAAFDDGRWGWLAEAAGNYYLTFEVAAEAPPLSHLDTGATVPAVDSLVVQEIGTATAVSAEGEIPWRVVPGSEYEYADLSGDAGKFATIDYSEEKPLVFKGSLTSIDELGLAGAERRRDKVKLAVQKCENCGGPLELRAPDQAERIICPNCGAAYDVGDDRLKYLGAAVKKKNIEPAIPIGSTGAIGAETYTVIGFMQRSVTFDRKYYWFEYLLYSPKAGFRWLVESDEHWSFVQQVPVGEVQGADSGAQATYAGVTYKIFQKAEANVEYVLGEFYWRVEAGEKVDAHDYVKAPYGLSREKTKKGAREMTWSHATYLKPKEVEKAFGVKLGRPSNVAPFQPFPGPNLVGPWFLMVGLLFVTMILLWFILPGRVVYNETLDLTTQWDAQTPAATTTAPVETKAEASRVLFSKPFELSGRHNVRVSAAMNASNTWAYVGADLVNEGTGKLDSFDLPLEYYTGRDSDGDWSEGNKRRSVYLRAPEKGRYVLRLESNWPRENGPTSLKVEVREGVVRLPHFILAFLFITFPAVMVLIWKWNFEVRRWKESDFNPYASVSTSDDDEE